MVRFLLPLELILQRCSLNISRRNILYIIWYARRRSISAVEFEQIVRSKGKSGKEFYY